MSKYSRMYNYVRSRQLEGTYNNDPAIGGWPVTSLRIMRGWGAPLETEWPYDGDVSHWPPEQEPTDIDEHAKHNRIWAYQRVRSSTDCKIALASMNPVIMAIEITDAWFDAALGSIPMPGEGEPIVAAHCITLTGYNDNTGKFTFANSWGEAWGDEGFGYLPYKYVDQLMQEAWVIIPHEDPGIAESRSADIEKEWCIPTEMGYFLFGIEHGDAQSLARKAWAFALQYEGYINIEEIFVRPEFRRQGRATKLLNYFIDLSHRLSLPIRIWLSHADASAENLECLARIAARHNLQVVDSSVRWAAYKIEDTGTLIPSMNPPIAPGVRHPLTARLPI
jgi:GNAT superfamily N-acetyltransferase